MQTLKAVVNGDGYEMWRQLLLTLRLRSKNRGLALMSAIMGWPGLQMNQAVQPQLLKLEDAFAEARKASVTIQEDEDCSPTSLPVRASEDSCEFANE